MPKLKLFATVDLGHKNVGIWEVVYPIKNNGKFKVHPSIKNHLFYNAIKSSVDTIQKSGKCILLVPNGYGWNDCINKDNSSDFYFAESVDGKHIINIQTETIIEYVKSLL